MHPVLEPEPSLTDDPSAPAARGLAWWGWRAGLVLAIVFLVGCIAYAVDLRRPPGRDSVDVRFAREAAARDVEALVLLAAGEGCAPGLAGLADEMGARRSYEVGLLEGILAEWGHAIDVGSMATPASTAPTAAACAAAHRAIAAHIRAAIAATEPVVTGAETPRMREVAALGLRALRSELAALDRAV